MKPTLRIYAALLAAGTLQFGARDAMAAVASSEIEALRAEIRALDQRLRDLERRQTTETAPPSSAAAAEARVTINDRGYTLASADAANSVRIRGLIQLDARLFSGDGGIPNNAFVLRRARLVSEGQFARNFGFQLVSEFAGSNVSILDAAFTVGFDRSLQFKFGKFKSPVGHELLQSDSFTFFNERSIATNLVPNRDLGIQASGELFNGGVSYQAGIFNGVGDLGSTNNTDFDNAKDLEGRLMVGPFKHQAESPLKGLLVGVSGSSGHARTAAGRTAGYRTDGQQTFFAYNPTVVADGQNWRFAPQMDFRRGPFGLMAEYIVSSTNVRPNAAGAKTELQNKAWQVTAGFVVTGEDSAYGGVVPRANFDPKAGTWGGLELVGRFANLKIDDAAFPLFASPASNASEASALGLGFNWFLSKAVVFKVDYYQTEFGFNSLAPAVSTAPVLRQDEQAFISRFQLNF